MTITIPGRIPSKKNSKQIICRGKRPMLLSSKSYAAWCEEQLWRLKKVHERYVHFSVTIKFWFPDNRVADLTNKAESIMDLLVDAGIILDDRWQVTDGGVHLIPMGIDKKNPRAEVELSRYVN